MKARALKNYLKYQLNNNIKYTICQSETDICVDSSYIIHLITINKKTLKLNCKDSSYINENPDLKKIYNELKYLIDTNKIQEFIYGEDEIENKLPVYKEENGEIIETYTDAYGYPNLTIDGYVMYDNVYFKDKEACRNFNIKSYLSNIESYNEYIRQRLKEIDNLTREVDICQQNIEKLRKA